jgi:glutamine phosphoribosylpyrophosphate amidotransferase
MCSIFGVLELRQDLKSVRKMALRQSRLMRHRGPDWSGIYTADNAVLAHERLSIVAGRRWQSTVKFTITRASGNAIKAGMNFVPSLTAK